ncbi:aldo/keto reductase [bacterium AH-315-E10]|nr:aldo/keto reductase [bacterium AH-315-E10]MBN4073963.1 aldo/keto reductase [bacterium AH-315-E10]
MEYRELGKTGLNLSRISFGASAFGGVFRHVEPQDCIATIHAVLDKGINFIDCSPYYGITLAETNLGNAFKEVDRDRFYLATKVGRYGLDDFNFSAERVTKSVDESLQRMNVDHIDLIQCHDIEFVDLDIIINETLPALQAIKESGKVRFIGITGLQLNTFKQVIDRVDTGMVDSILSYCRYSLNDHSLADYFDYFDQKGIGIINASPTGMGLLVDYQLADWHPAPEKIVRYCKEAVDHCKRKGEDCVKLAMQFATSSPNITTTLFGTSNPKKVLQNISFYESAINQALLDDVLDILKPIHNLTWASGLPENND